LTAVSHCARKLKAENPDLIYFLDPVIGDGGQVYVAPEVVPVYRSMLPLATVITPNYFEVETLTDIELKDITSLRQALAVLHEHYHVPNVVVSSIPLKQWLMDELPEAMRPLEFAREDNDYLLCLCSSVINAEGNKGLSTVHARIVPLIPGYYVGVGDLFSALLLGHFHLEEPLPPPEGKDPAQTPLSYATSMALTKIHGVLKVTYQHVLTLPEDEREPTDVEKDEAEPARKLKRMRGRELRLVQPEGQNIIRGIGNIDMHRMDPWSDFWTR